MASNIKCQRRPNDKADQRARLVAKNEIESFPNADDQKLIEGKKTTFLITEIFEDIILFLKIDFIDESKIINPVAPMTLCTRNIFKYENSRLVVNKLVKYMINL
jgi:hypothetical protein